jgi:hypothetical protein
LPEAVNFEHSMGHHVISTTYLAGLSSRLKILIFASSSLNIFVWELGYDMGLLFSIFSSACSSTTIFI